ncbi:hypothetical protein D1007_17098 [Hordeum vulgare]|nr:hypothetical protein D1007_17098 [Hordeum vulgare]
MEADAPAVGACDYRAVPALASDVPLQGTPLAPREEGDRGELIEDRVERPSGCSGEARERGEGEPPAVMKKRKWAAGDNRPHGGEEKKKRATIGAKVASYAELSCKLMKELEGVVKKVDEILEEEFHDLFFMEAARIFSHLLLHDPLFKFDEVMGLMLEKFRGNLVAAVEGHVNTLLGKFFCANGEEPGEEPPFIGS